MTPSIIRRFARYHGVTLERIDDASLRTEAYGVGYLARYVYNPEHWGSYRESCNKIIQSLTRIEDAELIMRAANPMPTTAWGQGFVTANESAHEGFLRLAGIDPNKWREVKDE